MSQSARMGRGVEWSRRNLEKGAQARQEGCGCQAEEATFYHNGDGILRDT